ncbi:MAG: hypothetical protein JSV48_25670, partial [Bradyrhizobium sp.]
IETDKATMEVEATDEGTLGKILIPEGTADVAVNTPIATILSDGESAQYEPQTSRHLYLVPAAGAVEINGVRVNARDGAAIRDEARLTITALEDSELVLVDAA